MYNKTQDITHGQRNITFIALSLELQAILSTVDTIGLSSSVPKNWVYIPSRLTWTVADLLHMGKH